MRVTIPKDIVKAMRIEAGDDLVFSVVTGNVMRLDLIRKVKGTELKPLGAVG